MERERFTPPEASDTWDFGSPKGLQAFTNDDALDLPSLRRDLEKPENIRWLLRNVGVRNDVPRQYVEGLERLLRENETRGGA